MNAIPHKRLFVSRHLKSDYSPKTKSPLSAGSRHGMHIEIANGVKIKLALISGLMFTLFSFLYSYNNYELSAIFSSLAASISMAIAAYLVARRDCGRRIKKNRVV